VQACNSTGRHDPGAFAGSGTTVQAALMEGFNVIAIEMTDEYLPLIVERIERYGEMLF